MKIIKREAFTVKHPNLRDSQRPWLPQTRKGPAAEYRGISDATLKETGNPQGPEHLGIALRGWRPTDSTCARTKNLNKHKEIITHLTNQSRSFTPNHTPTAQERHLYPPSRPTYMYTHTIPMVTNHPPILHPIPTLSPLSRGTDKDTLTPLFFFVVSTVPTAAVQGGHPGRTASGQPESIRTNTTKKIVFPRFFRVEPSKRPKKKRGKKGKKKGGMKKNIGVSSPRYFFSNCARIGYLWRAERIGYLWRAERVPNRHFEVWGTILAQFSGGKTQAGWAGSTRIFEKKYRGKPAQPLFLKKKNRVEPAQPVLEEEGKQRKQSDATSESTGTRLIVTSCPPVASCWWRDKSPPSLTFACR